MSRRAAQKLLAIIVLSSLVVLLLNFVLARFLPDLYAARRASRSAEQRVSLDELPEPPQNNQVLTNDKGIAYWPLDSLVTNFRKVDLKLYLGRARDEKALRGIRVFLDPGPSVTMMPATNVSAPSAATPSESNPNESNPNASNPSQAAPAPAVQEPVLLKMCRQLKVQLEKMGAEVTLLRGDGIDRGQDVAVAAELAEDLNRIFLQELAEQKFTSSPLTRLEPYLAATAAGQGRPQSADQKNLGLKSDLPWPFFAINGVYPSTRLLLDVQRQFTDVLFINFNFSQSNKPTDKGCRFSYFGQNTAAAVGVQAAAYQPQSADQPAYVAYDTAARQRLALLMERNVSGFIPEARYVGSDNTPVVEEARVLNRLNNVTSVQVLAGFVTNPEEMAALARPERQKALVEALANACYEYYCTDILR